jgi:hypothetical protein
MAAGCRRARWVPDTTLNIVAGQMRAVEFVADPGDWPLHCHKTHHAMNAMGHDVPNDRRRRARGREAHVEARLLGTW